MEPDPDICLDDLPLEQWEVSFNRKPTQFVIASLAQLARDNPMQDISDSISILSSRPDISDDESKIKYIAGILRQKRLERESPEIAAEEKKRSKDFYTLQKLWKQQPRGSGYLHKFVVFRWLKFCTVHEIQDAMILAEGIWSRLKAEMDDVLKAKQTDHTMMSILVGTQPAAFQATSRPPPEPRADGNYPSV